MFSWQMISTVGMFLAAAVGFHALGDATLAYAMAGVAGGIVGVKSLTKDKAKEKPKAPPTP